MIDFNIADQLAKDLATAEVAPNEAQKALAYLRSKRDLKALFAYLDAIVKNGKVVIRSQQTRRYYEKLKEACRDYLQGMNYSDAAQTLGWALRLLRYYRKVKVHETPESAVEQTEVSSTSPVTEPEQTNAQQVSSSESLSNPTSAENSQTTLKTPKQVGDVFTGKVLEADDEFFRIEVPGYPEMFALLKREAGVPAYRPAKDAARVEVVRVEQVKRKIVLYVKRAPRAKN